MANLTHVSATQFAVPGLSVELMAIGHAVYSKIKMSRYELNQVISQQGHSIWTFTMCKVVFNEQKQTFQKHILYTLVINIVLCIIHFKHTVEYIIHFKHCIHYTLNKHPHFSEAPPDYHFTRKLPRQLTCLPGEEIVFACTLNTYKANVRWFKAILNACRLWVLSWK